MTPFLKLTPKIAERIWNNNPNTYLIEVFFADNIAMHLKSKRIGCVSLCHCTSEWIDKNCPVHGDK